MKRLFGRSVGLRESLKKGHKIERNDLIMRKPAEVLNIIKLTLY